LGQSHRFPHLETFNFLYPEKVQRDHIAHSTPVVDLSISLEMDELFDVFEDKPQAVTPSEAVPKRPKKDKSKKRQVNGDVKKPEDAQTEPD
jgi:hypothetical protein